MWSTVSLRRVYRQLTGEMVFVGDGLGDYMDYSDFIVMLREGANCKLRKVVHKTGRRRYRTETSIRMFENIYEEVVIPGIADLGIKTSMTSYEFAVWMSLHSSGMPDLPQMKEINHKP